MDVTCKYCGGIHAGGDCPSPEQIKEQALKLREKRPQVCGMKRRQEKRQKIDVRLYRYDERTSSFISEEM